MSTNSNSELPFWKRISPRQIISTATICLGAVFLVAFFVDKTGQNVPKSPKENEFVFGRKIGGNGGHDPNEIREQIFAAIEPERIASTLRLVTKVPHVAGTEENWRVGENLVEIWRKNGIERVQTVEYDVLLSYPNWTNPNQVSLLSEWNGDVLFKSTGLSPDLLPHDGGGNDYKASIQWVAYSANGTVEGEPIYCHYGRREDFERLEREFGISSLKGKIAIIRYGLLYRGDKVKHAEERGAAGVVLFSDPGEVAWDGPKGVFPNTDEMPSVGVQRGSLIGINGDALTPMLPSREDFHKERTIEELKAKKMLPTIPAVPLGYGYIQKILAAMEGPKVPKEWKGGLKTEYRVGRGRGGGKKVRVEVHSSLEIKKIQNVLGIIEGSEEPDSWVMLGNHFDAWVFGALDPNSGTAILAEVGRAFAETVRRTGWRPKRSLVFCAWDAEEYGLIGSTEFVQEYAELLRDRAIVYLNLDLISANQTLDVLTVPSIYQAVTDAAKFVENPNPVERGMGRKTMFDSWNAYFPSDKKWLPEIPRMGLPGGASDYMSFLNFLAIPVVDFTYRNASWHKMNGYPLYHSRYERPFVNEHIFDHNNLAVHKAVGQYWAEMARSFADSPILPINATIFAQKLLLDYLATIRQSIVDLNSKFPSETAPALAQMAHLERQSKEFLRESRQFEMHSQMVAPEWANRRLRKLDQCFMNPAQGMAEIEREKRHVLFSLSSEDNYSTSVMTAVSRKIHQMAEEKDGAKRKELGGELALQLTVIQYSVLCATNILKPFF